MKSKQVQEFKETEIGKIPVDWEVKRLANTSTLFVPMRNKPKKFDGDIPWLRIEDLDGKFVSDSKSGQYVTPEIINEMNLRLFPIDTILCSCTATIGICAITQKELVTNQQFIGIYPTNINNEFLYYYLLTQKTNLSNIAFGTVGGYITRKRFEDFQIIVPPIDEQKGIVKVLSYLDTKIENLQNQNKILEQTGQAIFKSWFVDFDGVTEFEDSELGKIPKGWKIGELRDIGKIVTGKTPPTKNRLFYDGEFKFLKIPDMKNIFLKKTSITLSKDGWNKIKTSTLPPSSLSISCIGTLGLVTINEFPIVTNQNINSIIFNQPEYLFYIYYDSYRYKKILIELGSGGSVFGTVSKEKFEKIKILIPDHVILQKFVKYTRPIFKQISTNIDEYMNLEKTRDALLPKLMSGEIRV